MIPTEQGLRSMDHILENMRGTITRLRGSSSINERRRLGGGGAEPYSAGKAGPDQDEPTLTTQQYQHTNTHINTTHHNNRAHDSAHGFNEGPEYLNYI